MTGFVLTAGVAPRLNSQPFVADAQNSFVTTTFGVQDGLPEQIIQALAQTPDGSLWVGTPGGLSRFNGSSFVTFSAANEPAFHGNSVYALLTASDGDLWVGTEGSGLLRYRKGVFRAFGASDGLTDPFVRTVMEQSPGVLLIGTNNGFFRLADEHAERLDGSNGIPALAVNALARSRDGTLWIGGSGLLSQRNGVWKQWSLPGERSRNRVKSLLATADGALWVGTVSGLYRSPDGRAPFVTVPGIHGTVRAMRLGEDGTLWVSIVGQGGFGYTLAARTPWLVPKLKLNNTVLSFLEDGEGDLWVGTQSGLLRMAHTPISVVALKDSPDSDFGTVYRDRIGTLWAASAHLFQVRNGTTERTDLPELESAGAKVRNVLEDRSGVMWFGTEGSGLWSNQAGVWHHFTTANGLANNFSRVLLESRDGSLWIGTDEGVSHLVHGVFHNLGLKQGLAYFSIRSMLEDRRGDLWIGTEHGLSRWHAGTLVHDSVTEAMQHERVWAMHEDAAGGLWFGTRDDGLFHLRNRHLTHWMKRDGLASNAVYAIVEDASGRFWMSGSQIVAVMRRVDLEGAPQPHRPPQVTVYRSPSGPGTQMFGGMQDAGTQTADGLLWFPSNEGLIRIAPQPAPPRPLARMIVDHVQADGRPFASAEPIRLAPGTGRLEIAYAPLMLRSQDLMRFRYQLVGFDHDWTEAGSRRSAEYTNLPPGHYTFRVQGYEMDQPSRVSEADLLIEKRPAFYATWWFRVGIVLLIAVLVLLLHRLRVRGLKRQFAVVLKERSRLAREMHDTLIQGCTSVSAALEATARSRASQQKPLEPLLDLARTQIRETLQEARAAVWNLRHGETGVPSPGDELEQLVERMCQQIGTEFGVPVRCEKTGPPPLSSQGARHEVLMIVREAVHNAVMHGRPNQVKLRFGSTSREWTLDIHDDGEGFDPEETLRSHSGHFGLIGMRERATRIGGQFSIRSEPGGGTQVAVRVPLRSLIREQRHG